MRKEGVVPESPARVPAAPPRYAALCRTYTLFLIPGMHPSSLTLTPGNDVSHLKAAYYSGGSSRISPRFKISSFMQPLVSLRIQCFRQYIQVMERGNETRIKKRIFQEGLAQVTCLLSKSFCLMYVRKPTCRLNCVEAAAVVIGVMVKEPFI